jgi:hypothetical protein
MIRTVLVTLHAAAGIGGLVTGLAALSPPKGRDVRNWLRRLYVIFIVILLASMVVLVTIDWNGLDTTARISFAALIGLGAVMAYRLVRARSEALVQRGAWERRYVDHVYFTYISLWEGFVILPALNLPMPQLSVPLVAIAVLLIGHALISRYKAHMFVEVNRR